MKFHNSEIFFLCTTTRISCNQNLRLYWIEFFPYQLFCFFPIDIQDNHEEATIGAFLICELVETLSRSNDVDDEISEILLDMESKCNRPILHCVLFY